MQAPATAVVFRENWAVAGWTGLASGAVLAFYAFIGFEDMVNVAEEVKDPEHTYPKAIAVTLVVTALLYVGISVVAVSALSLEDLAASKAPLSALFAELSGLPTYSVDALATVAVVNGALIQIIMASRVIYGLASQGWLPAALGRINERTRTPVRATVLSAFVVVVFAFALTLVTLAKATSLITLLIFAIVNLALVRLGGRSESPSAKKYYFPRWVPFLGFVFSLGFALFQIAEFLGVFARA
jgi:amino acid transporter